jgi:hypothetical protein
VELHLPTPEHKVSATTFTLRKTKLRAVRRGKGRYVLRTNLRGTDPAQWWQF